MHFLQYFHAGRRIEVVQEVGQQDQIVRPAIVHIKGAARQLEAVGNAGQAGILFGHRQHVRPVDGHHPGLPILLRHRDPEQTMAGGDVEHLHRTAAD